jgi:two-component sensor histidine kinase
MLSSALIEHWVALEGRAYRVDDLTLHVGGIATDISARKEVETRRELLARDLEHRMMNVFSELGAIVSLSQRIARTSEELAACVQVRLSALARAHVLCASTVSGVTLELQQLIEAQLAPFADSARLTICGPPTKLSRHQAMALNMIIHELTTNAVKHGALSPDGGHVSIRWSMQPTETSENLLLRWKETCCSSITSPTRVGLGSALLTASARGSLGGDISFDFQHDGLLVTLAVPAARLVTDTEN